jgi:predicted cation transporter
MKIIDSIFLVDFTGGVVSTIISIVVAFAIIGALLFYVMKRRRSKKGMVHNKPKKNDHPENLK